MAIFSNMHSVEAELARTEARLTRTAQVVTELRADLITVHANGELIERDLLDRIALLERANAHT